MKLNKKQKKVILYAGALIALAILFPPPYFDFILDAKSSRNFKLGLFFSEIISILILGGLGMFYFFGDQPEDHQKQSFLSKEKESLKEIKAVLIKTKKKDKEAITTLDFSDNFNWWLFCFGTYYLFGKRQYLMGIGYILIVGFFQYILLKIPEIPIHSIADLFFYGVLTSLPIRFIISFFKFPRKDFSWIRSIGLTIVLSQLMIFFMM